MMQNETVIRETHTHEDANEADRRAVQDDAPTECGLTRRELRALVAEMIG